MMDKNTYRGKRKDNGEWVYGSCIFGFKSYIIEFCGFREDSLDVYRHYEVIPETVGQCTGMRDKFGTPIFEHDRVRYLDASRSGYQDYNEEMNDGVVDWDEETMCFYFTERWSVEMGDFEVIDGCMVEVEVIGTIHDNPEILEGV